MLADLWRCDAIDLAAAIREGAISSREATAAVLERIQALNPVLNPISLDLADSALAAADRADQALRRGEPLGPLHGVPVTTKENVDQQGLPTTNGVPAFRNVIASDDSPPVANWKRAGAIVVGRTNTPAFSLRWHTDNAAAGRTFNPWSRERTPGGSSGGAAVAVATGMGPLAHGNDLGGSVRYPAYCCGVAGIRPTLGRVPAFNPTAPVERPPTGQLMSVQGVLARRVRDVRLGLAAMAARDPRDPWWVPAPHEGPPVGTPIRAALCPDPAGMRVHAAVRGAVRDAGLALEAQGYLVEEIEPPGLERIFEIWATTLAMDIRTTQLDAINQHADPAARRCMELWLEQCPPVDGPTYTALLAERARHLREWLVLLERYPVIVGPTSAEPPFLVGFDHRDAAATRRLLEAQRLLASVNCLGLPAVAVPVGSHEGAPLGVQIIASRYREDLALAAAEVVEAAHGLPTPIDPVWSVRPARANT
jgi:amidase